MRLVTSPPGLSHAAKACDLANQRSPDLATLREAGPIAAHSMVRAGRAARSGEIEEQDATRPQRRMHAPKQAPEISARKLIIEHLAERSDRVALGKVDRKHRRPNEACAGRAAASEPNHRRRLIDTDDLMAGFAQLRGPDAAAAAEVDHAPATR